MADGQEIGRESEIFWRVRIHKHVCRLANDKKGLAEGIEGANLPISSVMPLFLL